MDLGYILKRWVFGNREKEGFGTEGSCSNGNGEEEEENGGEEGEGSGGGH